MAAASVPILTLIAFFGPGRSVAQFGTIPGRQCAFVAQPGCDNCAGGPGGFPPMFGCTAPAPNPWTFGNCSAAGVTCRYWVNYNCGAEITCATGYPTYFACTTVNLCQ